MSKVLALGEWRIPFCVWLARMVTVVALIMIISPALADENVRLYKTYYFGMTTETLLQDSRIYDCSNDIGEKGWLCLDNQNFGDTDVSIGFYFLENSLVRVALLTEFSRLAYVDTFTTLLSRFVLLYLSGSEGTLDVLARMKEVNENALMNEIGTFESHGLATGFLTYGFVATNVFREFYGRAENATDLIRTMYEHARVVEMHIEQVSPEEAYMAVRFEAPRLFNKMFEERLLDKRQKEEEF